VVADVVAVAAVAMACGCSVGACCVAVVAVGRRIVGEEYLL